MKVKVNDTTNIYALGNNLMPILKERKIRNKELAAMIGVHPNTIGFWCNGVVQPSALHVYRVAKALGVSMDSLMEGTE